MRRTIQNQILIPLIIIQGAAVLAVTIATATVAARRSERQVIDRLNGVIETLGHASFPYTATVLSKMRGLSGAEFIAYSTDGHVDAASFSSLNDNPPPLESIPATARLDSLGESPTVLLDSVRYFAVSLRSSAGSRGPSLLVLYPETSWRQTSERPRRLP